jgi:hypothetical protein
MTSWPADSERAKAPPTSVAVEDRDAADREWEEALGTGYGRRLWNVGCG